MEHKHIFNHIGGGCRLQQEEGFDPNYTCDDEYACECKESFRVYSTPTGHRFLPEVIKSEEMSEIKKAEQEALTEAFLQNIKKDLT